MRTVLILSDTVRGSPPPAHPLGVALLASVFVIATCGLLYELAAGALASHLLGDSALQFLTIIGTYLFAMGIESYLSRFFERQLPAHFLRIELLVALVGGALPATLFIANAFAPGALRFLLCALVSLAFPLVLLPQLSLIRTGLLFGLMNATVAGWALWLFRHELRHFKAHALACAFSLGLLAAGFAGTGHFSQGHARGTALTVFAQPPSKP